MASRVCAAALATARSDGARLELSVHSAMTAPYRSAIDLTCVAIGARSGLFRNQVVAVVGFVVATAVKSWSKPFHA